MNRENASGGQQQPGGLLHRFGERGVLRVAASYAVIAWLLLQISSVVFDPLGVPKWVMTALIIAAVVGFPIAIALAWFLEIGEHGIELDTAPEGVSRPTARGIRHYADAIVIGILVVAVVILLVRQSDIGKPKPPANPAIAVLPFENLSGDPQQEYFSDGLAQEVLDRLGRVPGLTVIARSSSFSFKGKHIDAKTVAERLGVTTLLEGSVRRVGNKLKLSAELVDGASGQQLWSGTFDREMTDVFQVQEELAAAVIAAIVPAARGGIEANPLAPTSDLSAYDLYMLGRSAQEARTGQRIHDSLGFLEKALEADPKYAKAHAALSRALIFSIKYDAQVPAPKDALQRAESEAYKTLALDERSSEGHAALATVMRERKSAGAEAEYKRALDLNPNNAAALWDYGVLLSRQPNRDADAARLQERLSRIDPRSAILWTQRLLDAASRPDSDRTFDAEFSKAIEALADDADSLNLLGRAARISGRAVQAYRSALAIMRTGNAELALRSSIYPWTLANDVDRAQRAAQRLVAVSKAQGDALTWLIEVVAMKGDLATWEKLRRQLTDASGDTPTTQRQNAFWLAVQGRYSEAAEALPKGEPLPDVVPNGLGSSMLGERQLLPAVLRIYRATGRAREADEMARRYFKQLRDPDADPFDLAVLAANEGLQDEAVRALKAAFDQQPLIYAFVPELPWFKSLEGHPGYDGILAERQRRIDAVHTEMLKLEVEAAGTPLDLRVAVATPGQ